MFVYMGRFLADVKPEQKQQMLGTSKPWMLNWIHWGWVSTIHGKIIVCVFRWARKNDDDHHLALNIYGSLGLFSWWVGCYWCIPKFCLLMGSQSPSWACFPWLLILEMPWHLQLKFLVCLSPSGCVYFVYICVFFFFLPASVSFSPLTAVTSPSCLACFPRAFLMLPTVMFSPGWELQLTTDVTCLMPRSQQPFVNWFLVQWQFFCFGDPTETANWKGPHAHWLLSHHQRFFLQSVLNTFIFFWEGADCEHFEAAPNSGILTQGGIFGVTLMSGIPVS